MAVCYTPGQVLGQTDLYIEVEDDAGNPTNAFSITYGIYFLDTTVTPSVEVLIPPSDRVPVNPSVGLYYASIQIPPNATVGEYLIRWSLRETSVSATQTVVMRFGVVEVGTITTAPNHSPCIRDLIHKFRVLTRDNCLSGETIIEVDVEGRRMLVSLEDLYEAIGDISPPPPGR